METFSTLVSIQIFLVTIAIKAVASEHAQYFQKILRQMAILVNDVLDMLNILSIVTLLITIKMFLEWLTIARASRSPQKNKPYLE